VPPRRRNWRLIFPKRDGWFGYAKLCLFLGDNAECHRARSVLLELFGSATNPKAPERAGRTCLLPAPGEEL